MTKRRALRLAIDDTHRKLLRRRHAWRTRGSIKAVKDYVTAALREAAKGRQG
jgi:hypothetical protein